MQALEALENEPRYTHIVEAIAALRAALKQPEQEPDRRVLQAADTHPAPCARHCEAKAFEIEIRSLNSRLKQQPEQEPVAQQYAKLAQHCTMLEQKLAQLEQRKPLTASEILNMMPSSIPAEHDGALMEFARAVEAATQPQPEPRPVGCECHRCIKEHDLRMPGRQYPLNATKMILCPMCGNKRCPKASDHRLDCTDSNESGQPGSVYTNPPPKP
jgi:hypothetical protein